MKDASEEKLKKLKSILQQMQSVLIAFSGGVDSTFLVKVAHEVLGDNVLAVTARSPSFPEKEQKDAEIFASCSGIPYYTVDSDELSVEEFVKNPPQRCYYCKRELFTKLKQLAGDHNIRWVADGTNRDDTDDFRPGMRAAEELGIRMPLAEADLNKAEIRKLSFKVGLPTWDKPSFACLASRFPYGEPISRKKLEQIGKAENVLWDMGFQQVRVRSHRNMARIEILPAEMARILDEQVRKMIVEKIKDLGFPYVTLDLQGYRTGSMNEVLEDL